MLSVTYKPFMMRVVMLNVIMLNVIMLSVVGPFAKARFELGSLALEAMP
jgi:hypothetical protein